jgi:N-sulfoglucosamine sulfohydrolase
MFNMFDPHVARKRQPNGQRSPQFFPDQVSGLPQTPLTADDVPAWPWQQIDTPPQRKKIAGYYNCVHRIDAAIAMLVDSLSNSGHLDDALIIFLGDHGPPFARGKTSCYEAGLRVPLIVRWPEVSSPHRSEKLVGSIDIYPTILDAAGVDIPEHTQGRSLRPVLGSSQQSNWRDTLVAEFHYHGASPFFPRRAITDGRFKLIHNIRAGELPAAATVDGDQAPVFARDLPDDHPAREAMERLVNPPEWELYDLEEDPVEFNNLADSPDFAETQLRLSKALHQWQRRTRDPFTDASFREQIENKYHK